MRCSWQPVLAASRIRLPVFGGISGSKMTTWNIASRSVLQLERDADARETVVAILGVFATSDRVDGRIVERRVTGRTDDLRIDRRRSAGGYVVAHHHLTFDARVLRRGWIELLRIDGAFQLRLASARRGVVREAWNDLAVHGHGVLVGHFVDIAEDQSTRRLRPHEDFARKTVGVARH